MIWSEFIAYFLAMLALVLLRLQLLQRASPVLKKTVRCFSAVQLTADCNHSLFRFKNE